MSPLDRPPMTCKEARDALSDRLDGELTPGDAAGLDAHLQGCPACARYAREVAFLHRELPAQLQDGKDDGAIWDRVQAALEADQSVAAPISSRRRSLLKVGMAASILLAAGVGGAVLTRRSDIDVAAETINDYLTFRASGKTLHIAAADPAAIETWLEERLDFDLAIRSPHPAALQLTGGRLCSFLGRRLAALHFVGDGAAHADASLYVMRAEGLSLPDQPDRVVGDRPYRATRQQGITSIIWKDSDLLYAAVSPIAEERLLQFAASV